MATVKQVQYRLGQAKKKLTKVNKELAATKTNVKILEAQLKRAKGTVTGRTVVSFFGPASFSRAKGRRAVKKAAAKKVAKKKA